MLEVNVSATVAYPFVSMADKKKSDTSTTSSTREAREAQERRANKRKSGKSGATFHTRHADISTSEGSPANPGTKNISMYQQGVLSVCLTRSFLAQ